ncbi:MAG: hypothetical protein ACI84O_001177 [Myxococcota bacterium]|jgi:hypothetical protein
MKTPSPECFDNELDREIASEWEALCKRFNVAQRQKPSERLKFFGELFEELQPWLEQSTNSVGADNYLLISTESIISYLFILLIKRTELPPANCVFNLWIESLILSRANEISELGARFQGCPGEAPVEVQRKFNKLTKRQRTVFYLYIIESGRLQEVSRAVGISPREIRCKIPQLWDIVCAEETAAPLGWRKVRAK